MSELSQLFPALDDDLSAVSTQFTFDQHLALQQHHHTKDAAALHPQPTSTGGDGGASGGEDDSDMPDVTDGDADMSLDLLACSSYDTEVDIKINIIYIKD